MNKLGRKWTMVLYSLPMALGFSLFVAAGTLDSAELIYIGRILTGFSSGAFALVAPLYIAEIGEDSMRGALGSITQLLITSGIAIVNGLNINGAVSWQVISALSVGPPGTALHMKSNALFVSSVAVAIVVVAAAAADSGGGGSF